MELVLEIVEKDVSQLLHEMLATANYVPLLLKRYQEADEAMAQF